MSQIDNEVGRLEKLHRRLTYVTIILIVAVILLVLFIAV